MKLLEHDSGRDPTAGRPAARRAAVAAGIRAIAPLVAGLVPLALTVGAAAARAGLPPLVGWASSALLYGASGQLTWMQVLHGGGPAAFAVVATLIVNLQLLLYGAAMRVFWVHRPRLWRIAAAHLLVSPVFAVATSHHSTEPDPRVQSDFYAAAGLTLWIAWLGLTGLGYAAGGLGSLPVLALVTPLVMLSLALRAVSDAPTLVALIVAATIAAAGGGLPYDLGAVGAGVAGLMAGAVLDAHLQPSTRPALEQR
jgi:predicted branched-subunit amino acid permease